MITVPITWHNVAEEVKLLTVVHGNAPENVSPDDVIIIPSPEDALMSSTWTYLVSSENASIYTSQKISVVVLEYLPPLDDGDLVVFRPREQKIEIVWQVKASTNSLFLTPACNSRCQFCPQPPCGDDGECYAIASEILKRVSLENCHINITGGEPTLNKKKFLEFMREFKQYWPTVHPVVLTNGRSFTDANFVATLFSIFDSTEISFAIPLYSDSAILHDQVVGVKGAFGETLRGLYNLALYRVEIELRFVVSKLSIHRLPNLVEFIGANLPFISRIAVMGIEPMGNCRSRWLDFWIDPEDCVKYLEEAYRKSRRYAVRLLLYNFQLCCLPKWLHPIACSTISEWKRVFIKSCQQCLLRARCGGFFASQNAPEYRPRRFSNGE